jgi:hypothetical protein
MQNLKLMEIGWCESFNQKIEGMVSLEELDIYRCGVFNQKLEGMQNLKKLSIRYCDRYNQMLEGMQNLQQLTLYQCRAFNQLTEEMQNLEYLKIYMCDTFKNFKTVFLLYKLQPDEFNRYWHDLIIQDQMNWVKSKLNDKTEYENLAKKSTAELIDLAKIFTNAHDVFLDAFPQSSKIYHTLKDIEQLVKQRAANDVIRTQFSLLKDLENYFDYLVTTIKLFPTLTNFLIRNLREEMINDIKELKIPIEDLPLETRMELLPLLSSPDEIQKTILGIPEEERMKWLNEPLQYEQFAGTTLAVLKSIKVQNLNETTPAERDNLLFLLRETLKNIPLKTLAAYAAFDADTLMAYYFALDEIQMAVVVPLLGDKNLLEYLEKQPMETHRNLLCYATTQQKEAYLAKDLLKNKVIEEWGTVKKPELEEQIKIFKEDTTEEKYTEIKKRWDLIYLSTSTAIQQMSNIIASLEKVLMQFNPDEAYRNKIKQKIDQCELVKGELQKMGEEINTLSNLIPGAVEIPEEFIDQITVEMMTDPYTDDNNNTLDKSTWARSEINPYTREPMTSDSTKLNAELKERIEDFRKKHPKL